MHPILLYLLKMFICSGILYGYYRAALYNERFHQWNRFYLLAALGLSVLIPLLEISITADNPPQGLVYVIETWPANIVAKTAPLFTAESIVWMVIAGISMVFFFRLLAGLWSTIFNPYRKGQITSFDNVSIIVTEENAAPYSFFKWLFWRQDMDPDSPHGKRVLMHELTHIHEFHSIDKIFTELILIFFWCNPFFWLIKKELYIIHEFLADRKAIEQHNGAAFAEMILKTINTDYPSALANPLFTSQLKRRLKMITTSNKPQFSYLRRLSALLAMVGVSLLLMLTIEKGMAQQAPPPPPPPPKVNLPDSIKTIDVNSVNGKSIVTIRLKNGIVRKMPVEEAIKKGYPIPPPPPPPPPPPAPPTPPVPSTIEGNGIILNDNSIHNGDPLYIYAGLVISKEQMKQIDVENIESVDVLKGEKAIAAYGEKGKNGVIKITPKHQSYSQNNEKPIYPKEVIVYGYGRKSSSTEEKASVILKGQLNGEEPPLYELNGKIISKEEMDGIEPNTIQSISVLKGESATSVYGTKGKNGVIIISTRESKKVFTVAEQMPQFPGGQEGWTRHLQKTLRYPVAAMDKGTQGKASVQFTVDKEGNLSDFEILINPGDGLGEEALRVIKDGPKWEPAVQNERKVNAKVVQVVTFRLN